MYSLTPQIMAGHDRQHKTSKVLPMSDLSTRRGMDKVFPDFYEGFMERKKVVCRKNLGVR